MKRVLFFTLILAICAPLLSQTKVVEGDLIVYNRYPVKNVKVIAKKAKSSTLTDSLGHFRLVCNSKDVISIESEVFVSQNIRVGKSDNVIKRQNLIFIDNPKNRELATGYGHISEDNLSFAIDNLEFENNDFCNYSDVFELMAGRFAGVTIQSNGSTKGVYIRGISSINLSSEALYVVDGLITQSLYHISPCEVKTINVLKDGSASLYGSRGANGVVVIETKSYLGNH